MVRAGGYLDYLSAMFDRVTAGWRLAAPKPMLR